MQLEYTAYRYRGYRASRPLVALPRAGAADLKRVVDQDDANQSSYTTLSAHLTTLSETRVSELQHYRRQLRFRLGYQS